MSERHPQVTAYVLGSVDYSESDRILTLLTDRLGKISARARGARKSTKRFGGSLALFVKMEALLERGRGDFWYVKEATTLRVFDALGTHLTRYNAAVHFIEFIRSITPEHEPDRRLYECFESALARLAVCDEAAILVVLFSHQLRALDMAGCGLTFECCSVCRKPVPPGRSVLVAYEKGGVVCSACGGGSIRLNGRCAAIVITLSRIAAGADGAEDSMVEIDDEAAHDLYGLIIHYTELTFGCRIKTSPLTFASRHRADPTY